MQILFTVIISIKREARVNQSCLTADIWLRAECSNTIPDRSKCQPNQLRNCGTRVVHGTGGSRVVRRVARRVLRGHRFTLDI